MALLSFKKAPDESSASTKLVFWGYVPNSFISARIRFVPVVAEGYTIPAAAIEEPISYTPASYSGGFKLVFTGPNTLRFWTITTSIGSGAEPPMEIIFSGTANPTQATAFFVGNPLPYYYSGLPITITINNLDATSSQQLVVSDAAV